MKDERDFIIRLHDEFTVCPAWEDVASVATAENRPDLQPNELMVFVRPQHPDVSLLHAFKISVESLLFPPDQKPVNGQHRQPSPE